MDYQTPAHDSACLIEALGLQRHPEGGWFAETRGGFSLVGCTVAPGFDFADFEMASRNCLTGQFPRHEALIARLTRG